MWTASGGAAARSEGQCGCSSLTLGKRSHMLTFMIALGGCGDQSSAARGERVLLGEPARMQPELTNSLLKPLRTLRTRAAAARQLRPFAASVATP